jgi:hypothetical protein
MLGSRAITDGRGLAAVDDTHAPHNAHQVHRVNFRETSRWVHFMYQQRHHTRSHLFDKKMAEEIIVLGKVPILHDLGLTPCHGLVGRRRRGRRDGLSTHCRPVTSAVVSVVSTNKDDEQNEGERTRRVGGHNATVTNLKR